MTTQSKKRSGCIGKAVKFFVLPLLAVLLISVAVLAFVNRSPATRESIYLTMSDGTEIAADVWLPANLGEGDEVPTVLRAVRYWRGYEPGPMTAVFRTLGLMDFDAEHTRWAEAGYAHVVVDVRGSGASFGQWEIPWSPQEIADLGEVVDWIVAQSWSNGRVGTYGFSYDGNTAEMVATLDHPAVKAVVTQYSDFDGYRYLLWPGGVYNQWFLESWDEFTGRLDTNDTSIFAELAGESPENIRQVMSGVRLTDDDPDGTRLAEAIASRTPIDLGSIGQAIEFRDDEWGTTGMTLGDVSPYSAQAATERSGVPMYVWASFLDNASAEDALSRFLTFGNPQKLILGPWNHGGGEHVDPFLPAATPTDPPPDEQFQMMVDFFDTHLKDEFAPEPTWDITYYTFGEGEWKTTETWPPAGFEFRTWYFGEAGSLAAEEPTADTGHDEYAVDWTATTGEANRWHTGLFMDDVIYPDRAEEGEKLLTYTTSPMETDVEITGTPVVTLHVASTEEDGALHVYLEDVAPDGRVTYLTEGILRAIHREAESGQPDYVVQGPYRSFTRADAEPLVPGEVTEVSFALFTTSVLIREGHSLRISVAGHDASVFARYPAESTPVLTVQRNSIYPSHIELPMKIRE